MAGRKSTHSISTDLRITGLSEWRRDINSAKAVLTELRAEAKFLQEQFKNNADSLEALTKSYENHQKQVSTLNKLYDLQVQVAQEYADKISKIPQKQDELTKKVAEYEEKLKDLTPTVEAAEKKTATLTKTVATWTEKVKEASSKQSENHDKLKNWQGQLESATKKLNDHLASTKPLRDEYDRLNDELEATKSELKALPEIQDDYTKKQAEAEAQAYKYQTTILQVNEAMADEKLHIDALSGDEEALAKVTEKERQEAEKAAEAHRKEQEALEALATEFVNRKIVEMYEGLVDALRECVDASKEFESAITNVQKTTDFSESELAEFGDQIKSLATDIPVTTKELTDIATAAGQMGVAKEDIIGFTEVMARLGVSTDLHGQEAVTTLAQLASVTGLTADEYDNLAASLVALGNNFATTEKNIVDMGQRLAGAASNVGMTEQQILALSTAVSSLGVRTDAGGTSMQSLINKMQTAVETGKGLEDWATVMGTTTDDLAKMWREDAAGALLKFIQALGETDDKMIGTLQTLGIGEQRIIRTVSALANAEEETSLLSRAMTMANDAWEENTALLVESGRQFETLESKQTMYENAVNNLKVAIGDELNPVLKTLYEAGTDVVTWAGNAVEEFPELADMLIMVTPLLGGLAAATIVTSGAFEGLIKKLQLASWDTILTNPVGLAVAAIGSLATLVALAAAHTETYTGAVKDSVKEIEEWRNEVDATIEGINSTNESMMAQVDILENLIEKEEKTAQDKALIKSLVDDLNKSVDGLAIEYDEEANALFNLADGAQVSATNIRKIAEAQAKQAIQEEKIEALKQLYVDKAKLTEELEKAQEKLNEKQAEWLEQLIAGEAEADYTEAEINDLKHAIDLLTGALDETNGKIDEYTVGSQEAGEVIYTATGHIDNMISTLEKQKKQFEETKSSMTTYMDDVVGSFQKVDKASETSYRTIMNNLKSQMDWMNNYSKNMDSLRSRDIDGIEEFAKKYADGTQESAAALASFAKMSDEEIENIIKAMNEVNETYDSWLEDNTKVKTGIKKNLDEISEAIDALNKKKISIKGTVTVTGNDGVSKFSDTTYTRNAQGLEYVPYDDYAALLHQGEMVLTRAEARAYRMAHSAGGSVNNTTNNKNYGGVTLNVYARQGQDIDKLADEIMYRIEDATKRKESTWA